VNTFLVAIWWFTGVGFFWPVLPIFAWGIAVVADAWEVYGREEFTEEQVQREMNRLRNQAVVRWPLRCRRSRCGIDKSG
jgi:hypothetical protein